MTDLAHYRKYVGLLITGALMIGLKHIGMEPKEFLIWGTSISEVQEALVDFVISVFTPGIIVLAAPNGPGRRLLSYWRWLVGGAVAAVLLLVGINLL